MIIKILLLSLLPGYHSNLDPNPSSQLPTMVALPHPIQRSEAFIIIIIMKKLKQHIHAFNAVCRRGLRLQLRAIACLGECV